MPRKKRMHLRGMGIISHPECHPNVLHSHKLAQTEDKTQVTCRNCQRLRVFAGRTGEEK